MTDKFPILILYAFAGLLIGLWPTIALYLRRTAVATLSPAPIARHELRAISAGLLIISFGLLYVGAAATPALIGASALIAVIAAFHQGRFVPTYALAVLVGLVIAATLPWWRRDPGPALNLSWIELTVFSVIATATLWILKTDKDKLESSTRYRSISAIQIGVFVAIAVILSFTTGFFNNTSWHHWGAYIGPSELLLTGAKLFRDFPAQYGFGPTVLIASVCGKNCWGGMYYLVGFSTLLFSILIAAIALGSNKHSPPQRALILLLVVVCCFLWTSYPPNASLATNTPSVTGLRFLPVLALVALLLWIDRRKNNQPYPTIYGHMAWAATALWSPESAFYATFVWWPYYLFLRGASADNNRTRTIELLRALGILLAVLVALVLCFQVSYWLVYQTTPSIYGYFAYALNPPGPMPIAPKGAVWFFIAVISLGIAANWQTFCQSGNSPAFRRGLLLSLMAYGTFSYYLGRSHDNNILNSAPFLLLVLLNVHATTIPASWRKGAAAALLACLLSWVSVFGWDIWLGTAWPGSGKVFEFNSAKFRQEFSDGEDWRRSEDAGRAITYIRKNFGEPVTVLDNFMNLASTASASAWSAIHGPANFTFIPSARRREFLSRTAATINRRGWLVIHKEYLVTEWLSDFDSVYTRTQELDFGEYHVIRYAPRTLPR